MPLPLSLAQQQANNIQNQFSTYLGQQLGRYRQQMNAIFHCMLGNQTTSPPTPAGQVAPADIIAALGTNAASIFALLQANYENLQAIYPSGLQAGDTIPAYTANEDGTVTLN